MERKVTSEERQVFLTHPELVMFHVDTRKKTGFETIALITVIILPVFLVPIALIASPFGEAHPIIAVAISVVFTVLWVFAAAPWLFIHIDQGKMQKDQESHYSKLLASRLPEDLICKTVTIEYVVYEKCEGAYIEDGKPQLFGYVGYRNIFKLVPGAEVVIVTDKKGFFAFIKRDEATESLYREEGAY